MKKFSALILAYLLFSTVAARAADQITSLTIYGNSPQTWDMPYYYAPQNLPGYAVINFARQASFTDGVNIIQVGDVPDEVDPSSIMIKNMGRNQQVIEQSFTAAKLSQAEIIKRAIGKEIEVEKYSGDGVISTKGTLLDSSNGLILRDGDKLKLINDYSSISMADDNNNSVAGNSIKWLINSGTTGDSLFEYSYKTQGISWVANYNIYLDGKGDDIMARIEGWANLINSTNINIKDTTLKLVAGEVAQANQGYAGRGAVPMALMAKASAMDSAESAPSMQQEKFSDYHLYTIERKINLPSQSSKKIKLFPDKDGVLVKKKYVFDGATSGDNSVKSVITFTNDEKARLGIPLPGGKYRVFSKDSSGAFEQAGETSQKHKAEGEKIELTIGNSFDLKAERQQMDSEQDQIRHRGKYTVTVVIESAMDEAVDVIVKEPIYQQNWEIVSKTHEFKKINVNQVEFTVPVKPKSKTTLEYIVQYSW
jgi:hypothetical protein